MRPKQNVTHLHWFYFYKLAMIISTNLKDYKCFKSLWFWISVFLGSTYKDNSPFMGKITYLTTISKMAINLITKQSVLVEFSWFAVSMQYGV